MTTSNRAIISAILLPVLLALFLSNCEMKEETALHPEIIISKPENNTNIVRGSEVKVTGRLKDFTQYFKVHRITLSAGDSILWQKENFVPNFTYHLQTLSLPANSQTITAKVLFTDEHPDDKDWNYFSARDYIEEYMEAGAEQPVDTLVASAGVTLNLTGHPGGSISMNFTAFSPDTILRGGDSIRIDSFEIGNYEVTNQQYSTFLNTIGVDSTGLYGNVQYIFPGDPSGIIYNEDEFVPQSGMGPRPVVNVTWAGASSFCNWMGGRLPTEVEWYYAADTTYTYSGSNTPGNVAWYRKNSGGHTRPVGLKNPNTYGIYDMSGNAAEWCHNWYNQSSKAYRGGHWNTAERYLKTTWRSHLPPDHAGNYLGFRVLIPH